MGWNDHSAAASPADETEARRRLVDDIATDETMPIAERQARLEELANEWNLPGDPAVDEVVEDPFRTQISNALALLAQGGHRTAP